MCSPLAAVVGGLQIFGMVNQAKGAAAHSQAQAAMFSHQATVEANVAAHQAAVERNRAIVADYQGKDAIARGQVAQTQQQLKTAQLVGTQRARFAAAGLDINEGSPLNVIMDTQFLGKNDELTIADNAAKEAWMYQESSRAGMSSASFIERQGRYNAGFLRSRAGAEDPGKAYTSSLLGGAGQVASSWYGMSSVKR